MTTLEQMIEALKNGIQKRIDENLEKKATWPDTEVKINHGAKAKAGIEALNDVQEFEKKVKRLLEYNGPEKNFLLCKAPEHSVTEDTDLD